MQSPTLAQVAIALISIAALAVVVVLVDSHEMNVGTGSTRSGADVADARDGSTATPPAPLILVRDGRPEHGITSLKADVGDTVRVIVASRKPDTVRVTKLGTEASVTPGEPAELAFTANRAGCFFVVLASSGARLARVQVST